MQQVLGPFHPVLVHLPIGLLLLAGFFQWLVLKPAFQKLEPAIGLILCWGMICAILSCITGYFLNQGGEYDQQLASRHQWLGISVAVLSGIWYVMYRRNARSVLLRWLALVLIFLITITGHLGGTITHGEGYLTKAFNDEDAGKVKRVPIADIQTALAYQQVIAPILEDKCYSCHGSSKQKGKLRLDQPEAILKGGKEAKAVVPGDEAKSELLKRIGLALNDEHHMPPKEKAQLSEQEIALLHWWVKNGADFTKPVQSIPQDEAVKAMLKKLEGPASAPKELIPDFPGGKVKAAAPEAIAALKKRGILVMPVSEGVNYLQVNLVNTDNFTDSDLRLLEPVREQLVWFKATGKNLSDSGLKMLSDFPNITRLYLDDTRITNTGLKYLDKLSHLKYLNIVGTAAGKEGVLALKNLPNLRYLYVYKTSIQPADWELLKKNFPKLSIDSGGYKVPVLVSDTTEVKEVMKK